MRGRLPKSSFKNQEHFAAFMDEFSAIRNQQHHVEIKEGNKKRTLPDMRMTRSRGNFNFEEFKQTHAREYIRITKDISSKTKEMNIAKQALELSIRNACEKWWNGD